MDSATKQAFLDNVNGWVFDEHKIVTYAWLSQELSLPANLAKKCVMWSVPGAGVGRCSRLLW